MFLKAKEKEMERQAWDLWKMQALVKLLTGKQPEPFEQFMGQLRSKANASAKKQTPEELIEFAEQVKAVDLAKHRRTK